MVGNPNHGCLYYRCTASRDYLRQHAITHPPTLYLREDSIAGPIDRFLRDELAGPAMTDNLRRVADAQYRAAPAAHDPAGEITMLRRTIADADKKINRYRATLDAGGDPTLIAGWITETTAIKKAAQARLGLTDAPPQRMTDDQLEAIAGAFGSLLGLLRDADPRDKGRAVRPDRPPDDLPSRPRNDDRRGSYPAIGVFDGCPRTNTSGTHTVIASAELAMSS
jgi:site-specific DNA recombinase